MLNKIVPYYKVRKHHENIFGRSDPVSFFELIYVVEAPAHFSGINIWEFVERIPTETLNLYHDPEQLDKFQITKAELLHYPYYELFLRMNFGQMEYPLIFTRHKDYDGLVALEGSHRIRLIMLFFMLQGRYPEIPCFVVDEVKVEKEDHTFEDSEKYQQWDKWREKNTLKESMCKARGLWDEFLRKE